MWVCGVRRARGGREEGASEGGVSEDGARMV